MKKLIFVSLALGLGWTSPAYSVDACDGDRTKVCSDITPGEGRVYNCLVGRQDQLTPECSKRLMRATELAQAAIAACEPEARTWCPQYVSQGRDAVLSCLKTKQANVQGPCKRAYQQYKASGEFDFRS